MRSGWYAPHGRLPGVIGWRNVSESSFGVTRERCAGLWPSWCCAWPDDAVLETLAGSMSLLPTGSAYCPGGCGELRIEPGRSLRGVVPYRLFGDEGVIAAEAQRTLRFEVHPWVCGR